MPLSACQSGRPSLYSFTPLCPLPLKQLTICITVFPSLSKPAIFCYNIDCSKIWLAVTWLAVTICIISLLSIIKCVLLSGTVSCHFSTNCATHFHSVHLQFFISSSQVELITINSPSHIGLQSCSSSTTNNSLHFIMWFPVLLTASPSPQIIVTFLSLKSDLSISLSKYICCIN